jgi:hypothetical protein
MNYFFSSLFRSKTLWLVIGLSVLGGLIIMDFLSMMLTGTGFFNLWTIKITAVAVVVGAVVYGVFLSWSEKKSRRLNDLLPGFLEDRRAWLQKKSQDDREFQTLCHECRHFDLGRLRCLLVLRERKAWIKLNEDSPIRHCLYWNLEDRHPVMKLTERLEETEVEASSGEASVEPPKDDEMQDA